MSFINDDFLLGNKTGAALYKDYAAKMPILDYHCHISPKEIYENRRFENIAQMWLEADHYKWRLMRADGASERLVTGDAPAREKFQRFAEMLPRAIGNPIYHWCHLELKNYFGYTGVLNGESAEDVWIHCNKVLKDEYSGARDFITKSGVRFIGTTDDPTDSLEYHDKIAEDLTFNTVVAPSFRPDRALNIEKPDWRDYIKKLASVCSFEITDLSSLEKALESRMRYFHKRKCRISDHGLDHLPFSPSDRHTAEKIVKSALEGESPDTGTADIFKTHMLIFCSERYKELGWAQQWHFSCQRNTNKAMFLSYGPDAGCDLPDNNLRADYLSGLLNAICVNDSLPRTVIYSLNPNDNIMLASAAGSFQGEGVRGLIQHGSAWWFNDTKDGMRAQLKTLASVGLLGNFIGMLTDSRSFLSYARHDYFRRILCSLLGEWAEAGEYPADMAALGKMTKDISFYNSYSYFNFAELGV